MRVRREGGRVSVRRDGGQRCGLMVRRDGGQRCGVILPRVGG